MMNDIKISICASAIRTQLWEKFYNSLLFNKVSFEVIFVGDIEPNFCADNFKWIYSSVKPAQCYEIAFREAQGDLIHWTADDVIYSEEALDKICAFYDSFQTTKLAVGFNCIENGSKTSEGHTIGIKGTPRMIPIGLMHGNYMKQLGGYDSRFLVGQAENDLTMRVHEAGGRVELCRDARVYINHSEAHDENTKIRKYYRESRDFLEKCWFLSNNQISSKRLVEFMSFKDENILTHSSEPRGEWQ